jgi:hypothetical protein
VWWWPYGRALPRWPSLIAVVERAERDVVVLFGVPLLWVSFGSCGLEIDLRCFCWSVSGRGRLWQIDQGRCILIHAELL